MRRPTAALLCATLLGGVTAAGPARAQSAPATPEPLRLGVILDMSSVYADVTGAGSEAAARMAIADFGGSVLGRKIELLVADHQNKADVAASIAAKWFDTEHVTALLDVAASNTALAAMNVAKSRQKIVMLDGPGATSITNESCTPFTVHYAYNTYALAHTAGAALVKAGKKSWYFLTADYTFGKQLEGDTRTVIDQNGGRVLGTSAVPLGTSDFSAYLLQAQQTKADVVALAIAGNDLDNAAKQATEFGLGRNGQTVTGLLVYINDAHAIGLKEAQGLTLASSFYWDMNDATRAFAKRFYDRMHKMPNMSQAGLYSSTMHYLQAVQAAGTTDAAPVMKAMEDAPIHDFFAPDGHIRKDGLMVHDMYLFQVKTPAESRGEWDLYKPLATIPASEAFLPLSESRCPLVR